MSKFIYVLCGHSNCGKTATLSYLRELLQKQGESTHLQFPHDPNYADRRETFLLDGKTICLTPGGDADCVVKDNLVYFEEQSADILVTASRSRGGTVDAIEEYCKNNDIHVERIKKSYEHNLSISTQCLCNHETAEFLLNKLRKHC